MANTRAENGVAIATGGAENVVAGCAGAVASGADSGIVSAGEIDENEEVPAQLRCRYRGKDNCGRGVSKM